MFEKIKLNKIIFKKIGYLFLAISIGISTLNIYPLVVAQASVEDIMSTFNEPNEDDVSTNTIEEYNLRGEIKSKLGVTLTTPVFENVTLEEEYTVDYKVTIPENVLQESMLYDEVVFLIDASGYMYGEKWTQVKNFFANYFENTLYSKNQKIGIVPFRNNVVIPDTSHGNNTDFSELLELNQTNNDNINMIKDAFGKDYIPIYENNGQRNIVIALEKAQELLEEGFQLNKKQAVILITSGDYIVHDGNKVDKFADYKHRIITVDISNGQELEENNLVKAKEFHYRIGGKQSDYISTVTTKEPTVVDGLIEAMRLVNPQNLTMYSTRTNVEFNHSVVDDFDEVIVAVDASSYMYGKRWNQVKDFFDNNFANSSFNKSIKLGALAYRNDLITPILPAGNNTDYNQLFKLDEDNNMTKIKNLFGNNFITSTQYDGGRALFPVLNRTIELFQPGRSESKKQLLILITSGEYVNYSIDIIPKFAATGTSIITINTNTGAQTLSAVSALAAHQQLGGEERNYITANEITSPSITEVLCQIFDGNASGGNGNGETGVSNVELLFDLGSHLETEELESRDGLYVYPINAEPNSTVTASFKVKLKENVQTTTFDSAVLSYVDSSGSKIEKKIDKPIFNTTQIPNINVTLKSANPHTTTPNSEFELVYGIEAEPFEYTATQNELKEIVFVIDGTQNKPFYDNIVSAISDKIFDDFFSKNNIKVGLVVYSGATSTHKKGLTADINSIKNIITSLNKNHNSTSNSNITKSLLDANEILDTGISENQSIIFITADKFTFTDSLIADMVNKYNIFSMEQTSHPSSLKSLHSYLTTGNKNMDIIDENYIHYNGNGHVQDIVSVLLSRLDVELTKKIEITDATLHLDLNNHFIYSDGNEKKIEVSIPKITYRLENQMYIADEINDIKIRITPKWLGTYQFAENTSTQFNNYLSYSNINKLQVKKLMQTPTVIIEDTIPDIEDDSEITKHGLFNGKTFKDVIGEDKQEFQVVSNMYYNFGFVIDAKGINNNFTLTPQDGIILNKENAYLYELDQNESIILATKIPLLVQNNSIRFEDNSANIIKQSKKYLVVYQVENATKAGEIQAIMDTSSSKKIILKTEFTLPDLL